MKQARTEEQMTDDEIKAEINKELLPARGFVLAMSVMLGAVAVVLALYWASGQPS